MNGEPNGETPAAPQPVPGKSSGKGSATALEALIRQRKRGELPQEDTPPPPPARDTP